jgi:hypothetical protein
MDGLAIGFPAATRPPLVRALAGYLPSLLDTADELKAVVAELCAAAGDVHLGNDTSEATVIAMVGTFDESPLNCGGASGTLKWPCPTGSGGALLQLLLPGEAS